MSSERVTQISDRLNFLSEQSETEERENLELQRHFRNAFYEQLKSVYKELHADHETGAADNK